MNKKIIGHKTVMSLGEAIRVSANNNEEDPDWTYVPELKDNRDTYTKDSKAYVATYDENGIFLGYL